MSKRLPLSGERARFLETIAEILTVKRARLIEAIALAVLVALCGRFVPSLAEYVAG